MDDGFIKFSRKTFDHFLWKEERAYSRFEAWLDMIATARWSTFEGNQIVQSKLVKLQRGQLIASVRYHAKRWSWGEQKVRTFRKLLTSEGMITQHVTQGVTVITLLNYGKYNALDSGHNTATNNQITNGKHSDNTAITQRRRKEIREEWNIPPNPQGGQAAKGALRGQVYPKSLDTDAFRAAWTEWIDYLIKKTGKAPTMHTADRQIADLASMGEQNAIKAIDNAIIVGLRKPCLPSNRGDHGKVGATPSTWERKQRLDEIQRELDDTRIPCVDEFAEQKRIHRRKQLIEQREQLKAS